MTQDPLDRLGERLFDVARREPPPEGGERRVLMAALRVAREARPPRQVRAVAWAAVAGGIALAAGIALWARPEPSLDRISAEPSVARPSSPAAAPSATPTTSALPVAPTSTAKRANALPSAPAAPSASATLTDELEALKIASSALNAGDAPAALRALDHYDHLHNGGRLRAEATMLRIQVLARSGNTQAAGTLAQQFVEQNPDSPLVDRARAFIQTTDSGGN
jgi:hypothetical protein